jgi:hypothetical protein
MLPKTLGLAYQRQPARQVNRRKVFNHKGLHSGKEWSESHRLPQGIHLLQLISTTGFNSVNPALRISSGIC